MKLTASINNKFNQNEVLVQTNGDTKKIQIPPKSSGYGSSINGGELLLLSLATCFCNDLYREASRRKMIISEVDVIVTGEFGAEGEPGSNFRYDVKIKSEASANEIEDLINYTDHIAEIHNTLRRGLNVILTK